MTDTTADSADLIERAVVEVKRVIVGQDRALERLMICLLSQGHALLEGVPGLAKTLAAETLARVVGGSFARIQFTPDLLPADVMGTRIYRASTEKFDIELGPVFVNFLLADEINRAPAKVQSALLEVMAEQQVSIGGKTHEVPEPFLVLATQNPIESDGVYPLPEAQRDRFLMKILIDYPTAGEEVDIVYRMGVRAPEPRQVLGLEDLVTLQKSAQAVFVDRAVVDYAVTVVLATRYPENYALADLEPLLTYGGSPRASLGLVRAARALALIRGREYVVPQDVFDVAPDVLRHRLVLSYEALAQGVTADQLLARVLSTVPAPRIAPDGRRGEMPDRPGPPLADPRDPRSYGATTAGPAYGQNPSFDPTRPDAARPVAGDRNPWDQGPAPDPAPSWDQAPSWEAPPAPGPSAPPPAPPRDERGSDERTA